MPYPWSSSRSRYGDASAHAVPVGTVTATPSIHSNPESDGPAPPERRSTGVSTCRPRLCRSVMRAATSTGTSLADEDEDEGKGTLATFRHGRQPYERPVQDSGRSAVTCPQSG